jgi:UDP-glucose 4-epimerase
MKALVTGGAGFIGSHIVDRLIAEGNDVLVYDNFSTGFDEFLSQNRGNKRLTVVKGDILDTATLDRYMKGIDVVWHMAANADVKENLKDPTKCLHQNTVATSNVLEAMRKNGVKKIIFASTGSVYGEPNKFPTPENYEFPVQTSMYGASKLACEGLLQAYATSYGFQVFIFRFVSFMGERYTHGCIFDFYKKLLDDPKQLHILGNGKQRKSYLYVKDGVNAMFTAVKKCKDSINIYNLGTDEYVDVDFIAKIVCEELKLKDVKFIYGGGERGWVGDSPFIYLDISKMRSLGWEPEFSIEQCVRKTINWLKDNQWALGRK